MKAVEHDLRAGSEGATADHTEIRRRPSLRDDETPGGPRRHEVFVHVSSVKRSYDLPRSSSALPRPETGCAGFWLLPVYVAEHASFPESIPLTAPRLIVCRSPPQGGCAVLQESP